MSPTFLTVVLLVYKQRKENMIHDFTVTTFNVKIVYFTNYSLRKKGDGWRVNIGGTVTGQG